MVLLEGIELSTSPLPRVCSTTELQQRAMARGGFIGWLGAGRNPSVRLYLGLRPLPLVQPRGSESRCFIVSVTITYLDGELEILC